MTLGKKIATARVYTAPAITQAELAKRLGVSTSVVGKWESEIVDLPRKHVQRLTDILNVKEEWLYDGSDIPPQLARKFIFSETRPEEPPNILEVREPRIYGRSAEQMVSGAFVAIPVWRGVLAGSNECAFIESDEPEFREIASFYTQGDPDKHVLCIASGQSMSPRIEHSEKALVRLDPDVPHGHIAVATCPEGRNYIKRFVKSRGKLELHSFNPEFAPITDVSDWIIRGGVTMIQHVYEIGVPNIEWDEGRFLRA